MNFLTMRPLDMIYWAAIETAATITFLVITQKLTNSMADPSMSVAVTAILCSRLLSSVYPTIDNYTDF